MAITETQKKAVRYFYCEEGLNMQQTGIEVGVSPATVKSLVDKEKLTRGGIVKTFKHRKKSINQPANPDAYNGGKFVILDPESQYLKTLPKRQAIENGSLDTALTIWQQVEDIIKKGVTQFTKFDKDGNPISFEIKLGLRELETASKIICNLGALVGLGIKHQMTFQTLMQEFGTKNKDETTELPPNMLNILNRISKVSGERITVE